MCIRDSTSSLRGQTLGSWGINVGSGYLVTGGADMQNKAAQGLSNILKYTSATQDGVSEKNPQWGQMSVSSIDPSGDWYGQYAQKFPKAFIPKQKHAGVAVPKSYQKQFDKYAKIVAFADKHGQQGASIDRAKIAGISISVSFNIIWGCITTLDPFTNNVPKLISDGLK